MRERMIDIMCCTLQPMSPCVEQRSKPFAFRSFLAWDAFLPPTWIAGNGMETVIRDADTRIAMVAGTGSTLHRTVETMRFQMP